MIGDSYLLHKSSYIIDLLPSNSLDWLISYELSKTEKGYKYYQYLTFLFLPGKSIILSFNLDRLTDILKNKHVILEARGNIPFNLSKIFSDIEFNKIVEYNIETPWNNTILIKPEEEKVLNLSEYQYLIDNWKYIKDIIITGYSFSKFENQIDDYYSLQLIIELTKYYQNKVFLIDPNPEYTQYIIEEGIKKKITILPLKWNILSKVILKNIINRGLYMLCNKCDTIMTKYYRLCE